MAVTQTVILREHNRIAVDLNDLNPHLSDERLRHMLIGQSHLKQISSSPSLPIENAGARPFAPSKRFHVGLRQKCQYFHFERILGRAFPFRPLPGSWKARASLCSNFVFRFSLRFFAFFF
jgi:hypothetical protein